MATQDIRTAGIGAAIIGCGYIADSYAQCASLHAGAVRLVCAHDRDPARAAAFARVWGVPAATDLDAVLSDPQVRIVINLTNPESHETISAAALAAGKDVYSEKPLAMTGAAAERLAAAARAAGRRLAGAPCNLLGESAQTLWRAVREGVAGDIRLIYAEMDDGMIHRTAWRDWRNRSGAPWPAPGEFEVGCTFEHAGYTLGVLIAIFGPVRRVTAFSHVCIPDKLVVPPLAHAAPDFSVGCLEFDGGIVARVTNSVVAPYDHRLRLIGERGVLSIDEPWSYHAPTRFTPTATDRLSRLMERRLGWRRATTLPAARRPPLPKRRGWPAMDFMRGVRELADAIVEDRPCRLSPELAVHITEVTEALQHPDRFARPHAVRSSVAAIAPAPWAA